MPGNYYELFKFFSEEHKLTLLDSEIQEIIQQVVKHISPDGKIHVTVDATKDHPEDSKEVWVFYDPFKDCGYYEGGIWYETATDKPFEKLIAKNLKWLKEWKTAK